MKRVAVLIAASPTAGFYSQLAAFGVALRRLDWAHWTPSVHIYLGGPADRGEYSRWLPCLREAEISWSSEQRFAADGDWAQSDDIFRSPPRDADVILTMDADTFPVLPLTAALDQVLESGVVAGVVAHYPFPRFPGDSVSDGWRRVTSGITRRPLDFAFSHTLMPPGTPEDLRRSPFYVNGGVVFFPKTVFDELAPRYLAIRPQLMSRMPNGDFTSQAALTLAIAECGTATATLPMRYNFPNDPIADRLYPDELASVAIFHYLRTDAFDRQRIFASAADYDTFLSLQLSGSNALFQRCVRRVIGGDYPFGRP